MNKRENYYLLHLKESRDCCRIIADPSDPSIIPYGGIEGFGIIEELPVLLEIKRQSLNSKTGYELSSDISNITPLWFDLLNNSLGVLMFSERSVEVITYILNGNESFYWVRCRVRGIDDIRNYYIPSFDNTEDVLNEDMSSISYDRFWVKTPVIDSAKTRGKVLINGSGLFQGLDRYPLSLYVADKLRKAMMDSRLTGISFDRLKVV